MGAGILRLCQTELAGWVGTACSWQLRQQESRPRRRGRGMRKEEVQKVLSVSAGWRWPEGARQFLSPAASSSQGESEAAREEQPRESSRHAEKCCTTRFLQKEPALSILYHVLHRDPLKHAAYCFWQGSQDALVVLVDSGRGRYAMMYKLVLAAAAVLWHPLLENRYRRCIYIHCVHSLLLRLSSFMVVFWGGGRCA